MSKSNLFIACTISFAFGIFLGSGLTIEKPVAFFVMAFSILAAVTFKRQKIIFICLFFIGLGLWRINLSYHLSEFSSDYETKQEYQATIVEDPDVRPDKQLLTIRPQGLNQNILATTITSERFSYGDLVRLSGKVKEPKSFDDFDYASYLERYNIYAQMQYPKILVLKENQDSLIKYYILKIKYKFVSSLNNKFIEPQSSLLLGILIGAKKTLPQTILDQFSRTGTSHIVAVSGYNISVLVGALSFLAAWIGRRNYIIVAILIIFIFAIASGASASVLRASIMGVLLILSFSSGRLYNIAPSLCLAGGAMLLLNPKILYWDIGFQLSFLATCGIVYILPLFELLTIGWQKFKFFKSILLVTMSATLATFPIILLNFGTASFISPLANVLILPVVPLVMFFGFFSILPIVGFGFSFLAKFLLGYILFIVRKVSTWPGAGIELNVPSWLIALASVSILLAIIVWYRLNIERIRNLAQGL